MNTLHNFLQRPYLAPGRGARASGHGGSDWTGGSHDFVSLEDAVVDRHSSSDEEITGASQPDVEDLAGVLSGERTRPALGGGTDVETDGESRQHPLSPSEKEGDRILHDAPGNSLRGRNIPRCSPRFDATCGGLVGGLIGGGASGAVCSMVENALGATGTAADAALGGSIVGGLALGAAVGAAIAYFNR